ncbi:uncharacterized protein LOC134282689 [Saccostrea cucullata]|uniref:uncharacterized protein LOC134282689 n=1 Tax=Saccostrea cuccullata TaxID=36930 RepID=UPI002ED1CB9B
MQSDQDFTGGAQSDQMLQVILNKMNEQKADMERTMAGQLEQFKQELHGATSSVSTEVKKLKSDQGVTWKNSGSHFVDQRPSSSDSHSPELRDQGSPLDVSIVEKQTTKGKIALSLNRASNTEREFDLVEDKYLTENIYFDSSHFSECYEYKENGKVCVRGRLKDHILFWKNIDTCKFILDTIEFGYKIPFYSLPQARFSKNNKSALQEDEFVRGAIEDLLDNGLISEEHEVPFVTNPLSVSVNSGGKRRLILDLREVNKHVWKQSVKYDDLRTALLYVNKNSWCFKFDITSAYHHIDIFPDHRKFLGFSWNFDGITRYFQFNVLPFGLTSAPYIFTKLTRSLIRKWRSEGKTILMYLDDGFGCHCEYEKACEMSRQVHADIVSSGFVPKAEKSMWVPCQIIEFLGICLNCEQGTIHVPTRRLEKVSDTILKIEYFLSRNLPVKVRRIASLVGQIISMSVVIGNISQLMTRSLSIDILSATFWNSMIYLSEESLNQILFWKNTLEKINDREMKYISGSSRIVYTDASETGYGGYCVQTGNAVSHGLWEESERNNSSTWRELVAVERVLFSLISFLEGENVKWFTDNTNVVTIIRKGSMKKELQKIAIKIFELCLIHKIQLEIEWIPRELNDQADYLSRIVDFDDWGISQVLFEDISREWGPYDIDLFASDYNAKVEKFCSRYWNPFSFAVDAFTLNWAGWNAWIVPPIYLIPRVLDYLLKCRGCGTLIAPFWESSAFWPILISDVFKAYIVDWRDLPVEKEFYTSGKLKSGMFGQEDLKFRMLAILLDFRD